MNRVNDKIKEIEKFSEELESVFPLDFEKYKKDFKTKAICERYFEKIVEAVVDLAFLVIKDKGFKIPEEDKQAFDILEEEKVISDNLCNKLKDAKGMRNIIAHEYGKVDDGIVFGAITKELISDVKGFLKNIKNV